MAIAKKKAAKKAAAKPKTDPYKIVWWVNTQRSNEPVDARTKSALEWVEKKSGIKITVVQGSYQARFGGGASASAGTHDQGGVVDVMTINLTRRQRIKLIRWAKRAGFAAWYRNWPGNQHSHWVLRGHRNLAPLAAEQVRSYDAHRNGLADNAFDRSWRPKKSRRWSYRKNRPVIGK